MNCAPLIHVVDDDESFRTSLSSLLTAAGYEVQDYASAGEFLLYPVENRPGCILLDINMPGPNGLELQTAIATRPNRLPVIFLTGFGNVSSSVRAMQQGAADFLPKPVEKEVLLNTLQNAIARDLDARALRDRSQSILASYASLSLRERQVFEGVVAGKLNKQIAGDLAIAERTVKAHRARVMAKMNARSVADLVRFADQLRSLEV